MGERMNNSIKKGVVVSVILFFISVSVIPTTGNRVSFDDTTPPVTTCTLNPPEPNGNNSWYVSDVEVTLNATDDMSGVNATYYRIDGGPWMTYTEPFIVTTDGEHTVQYKSVDNAGNIEDSKSVEFKIDQTPPTIDLVWEANKEDGIWNVIFTAICSDVTSNMDYVEFYMDDDLMFTDVIEPYKWIYTLPFVSNVIGLILNPQFSEKNVTFFALLVIITNNHNSSSIYSKDFYAIAYDMAGNSETDTIIGISYNPPGVYMFQRLTFPNNYKGYIGKFLIRATFDYE
jgi:hypothetical protein